MGIYENATHFAGRPIEDFNTETGITNPETIAYRVALSWEDYEADGTWADTFAAFVGDPRVTEVTHLVIGNWGIHEESDTTSEAAVEALVAARERLPHLKALFLGDINSEECEVSWLQQSDLSPLFTAYPNLEYLHVKGTNQLFLGSLALPALKELTIETGGLPASVLEEVLQADLPALEHLELWLGTEDYGGEITVEGLAPLLSGDLWPKLTYLGLRDSQIADSVAVAVATSPILERVQILDLSLGALGDEGVEALAASPAVARLQKLDVHHHYISEAGVETLKALGIPELDVSDRMKESYDRRYIALSE
jgi:hypothetical protein